MQEEAPERQAIKRKAHHSLALFDVAALGVIDPSDSDRQVLDRLVQVGPWQPHRSAAQARQEDLPALPLGSWEFLLLLPHPAADLRPDAVVKRPPDRSPNLVVTFFSLPVASDHFFRQVMNKISKHF